MAEFCYQTLEASCITSSITKCLQAIFWNHNPSIYQHNTTCNNSISKWIWTKTHLFFTETSPNLNTSFHQIIHTEWDLTPIFPHISAFQGISHKASVNKASRMTHRPNTKQVNEDVSTEFSRQHLQPTNTVSAYQYTIVVTSDYHSNSAEWWNNSVNYCRQNHEICNRLNHTPMLYSVCLHFQ